MQIKLLHEVRAVKSKKELANIVQAQRISERVLADAVKKLRVGISEIEIDNFIKKSYVKYGAPILSFPLLFLLVKTPLIFIIPRAKQN